MQEISLNHHGVKGMKWGVRRYQKKDGSLTSAGKKRYINSSPKKVTKPSSESKQEKKTVKDLSDEELRKRITRLQLEKQYKDLQPQKISAGKKFVDSVIIPAVNESAKNVLRDFLTKQGKELLGMAVDSQKDKKGS